MVHEFRVFSFIHPHTFYISNVVFVRICIDQMIHIFSLKKIADPKSKQLNGDVVMTSPVFCNTYLSKSSQIEQQYYCSQKFLLVIEPKYLIGIYLGNGFVNHHLSRFMIDKKHILFLFFSAMHYRYYYPIYIAY